MTLIEGYVVLYKWYLWMVKGCEHPEDGVIAYPRYSVRTGSRIKDLRRAMEYAEKLGVIRYYECLKESLPILPLNSIELVLDPFNRTQWPRLPNSTVKFLENLGIAEHEDVGLTGSYLASTVITGIKPRDIDIIIRNRDLGETLYEKLKLLRASGVAKPVGVVDEFYGTDPGSRLKLLRHRVLEGVFNGIIYSIRILSCKERAKPRCIKKAKLVTDQLTIVEHISPYVMPYTYIAEGEELGTVNVRSLRMRYSEIPLHTRLSIANCRLEYYMDGGYSLSLDNRECRVRVL
ncbi:MAG: hypothetical protein DRO13_03545 [Thermoprotei archaeon]|nr:MAG: hypothetical protein DRO13_03545 [Thermoprotei archaeon]